MVTSGRQCRDSFQPLVDGDAGVSVTATVSEQIEIFLSRMVIVEQERQAKDRTAVFEFTRPTSATAERCCAVKAAGSEHDLAELASQQASRVASIHSALIHVSCWATKSRNRSISCSAQRIS